LQDAFAQAHGYIAFVELAAWIYNFIATTGN
jgi:hypothetical protein